MKVNDWFFDMFENQIEKNPRRTIATSWAVMFVVNLAIWGVIVFALATGFQFVFGGLL